MAKKKVLKFGEIEAHTNSEGGVNLYIENDGKQLLKAVGNLKQSIKFWENMRKITQEVMTALNESEALGVDVDEIL